MPEDVVGVDASQHCLLFVHDGRIRSTLRYRIDEQTLDSFYAPF